MAATTERYPIKAKSLTLLELCQSIHDFRNPSSRNTAQILTRRLYLHPLTINANAKTHDEPKKTSPHRRRSQRDFTLHSSSVPLLTRMSTKVTPPDFETSQSTFATNRVSLPPVLKPKRSVSTRPSHKVHPKKVKPLRAKPEKVDVWEELANTLQRPVPQDPPTTPFHDISELYFESTDENDDAYPSPYHSIQEIKIFKRTHRPDQA